MRKTFFKIKHWWRKQDPIFKMDFKFQAVVLFIGIILCIFRSPALLCIIIPIITHALLYSDLFRIEKYALIKIIKHHKDYIHILKEINKNEKRLVDNLEGRINNYRKLLNYTYIFVPESESQKFTIHKRSNECYVVENGRMVPYDIYVEILTNSDKMEN
jgi:hypothetical protein